MLIRLAGAHGNAGVTRQTPAWFAASVRLQRAERFPLLVGDEGVGFQLLQPFGIAD